MSILDQAYKCDEMLGPRPPHHSKLYDRARKLQDELHWIEFELTSSPENYDLAMKLWDWLKRKRNWGLTSSAGLYSRCQWDIERNEEFGRDALFTLTTEGPLYDLLNYGEGPESGKMIEKFDAYLDSLGIYYEMGYGWSLHFYPRP
jgi:hypothetical protein